MGLEKALAMPAYSLLEPMKYSLINWFPVLEVLDDNQFQERGCDLGVPDSFRIHDDDRPVATDTKAGGLATLHAPRTKEQIFALEKVGEQRIELASPAVGRAEVASAYEHVTGVRLHLRLFSVTHAAKIHMLSRSSTCTAAGSP